MTAAAWRSGRIATSGPVSADRSVAFLNSRTAQHKITVCKVVEDNGDSIADQGGAFEFDVEASSAPLELLTIEQFEGDAVECKDAIVEDGASVRVHEYFPGRATTGPGATATIRKYDIEDGASRSGRIANLGTVNGDAQVTFTNQVEQQQQPTGDLVVEKHVIANLSDTDVMFTPELADGPGDCSESWLVAQWPRRDTTPITDIATGDLDDRRRDEQLGGRQTGTPPAMPCDTGAMHGVAWAALATVDQDGAGGQAEVTDGRRRRKRLRLQPVPAGPDRAPAT
ncbi:MAG: hypothetical protein U5Q44_06380 [Dehalococcoidia bacterium]|nr:hypothetical protein [Dehalococcoidia bacterium]